MGFIIWYKIQITEDTTPAGPLNALVGSLGLNSLLTASNDVFSGEYIVDADITVKMIAGASASTFEIRLLNLPKNVTDTLASKHNESKSKNSALQVKVFLGYFEDLPALKPDLVMVGAIMDLESCVNEQGLMVTRLSGQELAGFRLLAKGKIEYAWPGSVAIADQIKDVLKDTGVYLDDAHGLIGRRTDYTLRAENALDALDKLAAELHIPVVVRDSKVFLNKSVGAGAPVAAFTRSANLIQLNEKHESEPQPEPEGALPNSQRKTTVRTFYQATVLGNPKLRAGHIVTIELAGQPAKPVRIQGVVHSFSSQHGYTCDLVLVDAAAGVYARAYSGANAIAALLRDTASAVQRYSVDVGEITAYEPGSQKKHRATLNYGQSPASAALAPSVDTPINDAAQLYRKPLASPFAWHKCGLILPVYPGMRALLAHNLDNPNDAVISGFLWPDNPQQEPPQNEPGDYWLCLPVDVGENDTRPTGKAADDLIDGAGRRVIQTKGLRILVGADTLNNVGVRPQVSGEVENAIVIEHQSGTKITIDSSGAVNITTNNKDILFSNGGVNLKLSGSQVQIS